jgi:hypothetical protein
MALLVLPASNAAADVQLDWLELRAFFDEFGKARLDELSGGRRTLEEEQPEDIAEFDVADDAFRSEIETELENRKKSLGAAYPFDMTDDGEEIGFTVPTDSENACFYLLCLIASHISKSPILTTPPAGDILTRFRNRVYQVMGTLAVAGHAGGPAISLGFPRETKESILDALRRAESWGIGLAPRDKPGRHANPQAKDGGIDVIGWPFQDRPPPSAIWFGQLASGHNWLEKPANLEYRQFINDFFDDIGTGQHNFVTLIPFRVVDDLLWNQASNKHGHVCERCTTPKHALAGISLAKQGMPMDEAGNVAQITNWLADYRVFALAA